MKPYRYMMLAACLAFAWTPPAAAEEAEPVPEPPGAFMKDATPEDIMAAQKSRWVSPREDARLRGVEDSGRVFKRLDNPMINRTSYFHQRRIGDVLIEKDFIRYQFDATTGELLERTRKWREGLPERLEVVVSQAEAEAKVPGTVQSADLVLISPDSEIFHFEPVPANPCWVIHNKDAMGRLAITVVDAVTGELLGNGLPPPSEGQAIGGPNWGDCPQPVYYGAYASNADSWFDTMGYTSDYIGNASETDVYNHLRSDDGVMFYALCHGGATSFHNRCDQDITATEVESWIAPYASMGFAFIGSCGGLCDTAENTFASEFSKGHNTDTTVVGYCGMDTTQCWDCWPNAIAWQTELFTRMDQGYTVGYAFALANSAYPDCTDDGHSCMRIFGDINLVFGGSTYPDARRSRSGSVYDYEILGITIYALSPVSSTYYTRAHHLRGTSTVPSGYNVDVHVSSSYQYNEIAFDNNAVLTATGTLNASSSGGSWVRFVSAADKGRGIEILGTGELRMLNGGQMKIYE
ncbi:MAG: hypothetical protein V2I40_03950 [Desulfobacteraceae bacterium]|jgi:hypothetical protein|nr:hypothetical protein [Desulfobacteraceae bacterium]